MSMVFFSVMVHLATGFVDAAIAYATATTYLHMFVCPCVVTRYLHFCPQGGGSRQCKAWGFEGGPLIHEADMTAYTEFILKNSPAPPGMTRRLSQYVHLHWLSKVVVRALHAAKLRFSQSHQLLDMSASVSIDKFCLATLDEVIDLVDENDRLGAMREANIGGECVEPNHYFQQ